MIIQEIYNKVNNRVILPTFGGQSWFTLICENNNIKIVNSNNNELILTQDHLDRVVRRYSDLAGTERYQGLQYTRPTWQESQNIIFDPYIAKIVDTFS